MTFNHAEGSDDAEVLSFLQEALQATTVSISQPLQSLWGNQGSIVRVLSDSEEHPSAVLKLIRQNRQATHPRGWNSDVSFARKAHSYGVESHWYAHYARRCSPMCKVPQALGVQASDTQRLILLEDLSVDYPLHGDQFAVGQAAVCLSWLANFHALFMHSCAEGLWEQGSYWHLATRQEEYAVMADGVLKQHAGALDERLRNAAYQTLVHGDAKVANFCFSAEMKDVAAVDFQYVGKGCGMRDVVYLLGSCLSEADCFEHEQILLSGYFDTLRRALEPNVSASLSEAVEHEWRGLYDIAWADFHRFLAGWMPSHTKINGYTRMVTDRAIERLQLA